MLEKNSFRILALVRITITIKLNTFTFINSQRKKKKKRIASFVTKMNKTKDPITRWYKKKKKLFENKIDYFPLHTQAHIHAHTFIADTSNDWCFACTKGGRICPEWCETVQQRLWIIPRANKVAYPDGPRAIPPTYTETIYIYRSLSYPREDQRFKAVRASGSRSRNDGWEIDFCIVLWSSIIEIFQDTHSK